MTYVCTLSNNGSSVTVDLDNTYNEGGGPQYVYVNEVAVLEVPADSSGNTQAQAMDLKYTQESVNISGQFMDGLGIMDWITPGSTKVEKLLALAKIEILPLILTWPVSTKTWNCIITRVTFGEQGSHGKTISYDLSLRIVGAA